MKTQVVSCFVVAIPCLAGCGSAPKTDAATPAVLGDPAASLSGARVDLPCKGDKFEKNEECHWDPSFLQTADPTFKLKREVARTFAGKSGALYDVTLRIRGVVEPKNFSGGVVKEEHFQTGGTAVTDHYNFYNVKVSDPPETYTVNRHQDKVGHFLFALDYKVTIPIRGGATVTLGAYDSNDIEIANHKSLVVPDVAPSPLPFDGQFFQIDVVSVAEKR
jgi:hypothetical protein